MSEQNNQHYLSEDEIDLLEIIAYLTGLLRRRFILLLIAIILGAGGGSLGYFFFQGVYTSQAVFRSRSLSSPELIEIAKNLDKLIEEKSYDLVAKKMKIKVEEASKIKSLSARDLAERTTYRKDAKDSLFIIEAKVYDATILPKLNVGLFYYYNENEFIKNFNQGYLKSQTELLERIQSEIKVMNTIKTQIAKGEKENQNTFLGDRGTYSLLRKEARVKKDLHFKEDIQIIQGFTQYRSVSSFDLPKSIMLGAVIGLVFGILIIITLELNIALKRHKSQKSIEL